MVIFCGGLATRLGNLAKNLPKSMMEINGKPFLEYQIENVKKHGIINIVLCVGHLSDKIINYFGNGSKFDVNINYSHDGKIPLGPIGALKKAEQLLENEFFIMYGDSYTAVDFNEFYNFFKTQDRLACMAVYKNQDKYDKSNLLVENNMVTRYNDKEKVMNYIDYGTSLLNKKTIELIPENIFFTTGDFFIKLIQRNELLAYEVKNRFYHIGNPEALDEFRTFIKG
jgi:NDP-sugar pyrophosphorylase family protein